MLHPRELLPFAALSVDAPGRPDQVVERLTDDRDVDKPFVGDASSDAFTMRLRAARYGREPLVVAHGSMQPLARATHVDVFVKPHGMAYLGMLLHGLIIAGVLVAPAIIFHAAQDPRPEVIMRSVLLFLAGFALIELFLVRLDVRDCDRALRARLAKEPERPASYR